MYKMSVLSPVAEPAVENAEKASPAAREPSLTGKRVGLLWNGKRGGEVALDRIGQLLLERSGVASVKRYNGSFPFPPALLEEAIKQSDVVVGATGD
jgi:hypothetical protein